MSLLYIGQQITIYGGLTLLITGVIGNVMNILIFLSVRTYRKTPCTFYFLVISITNILFLFINLTSRIVSTGFSIDLTRTSIIWCKTRYYLIGVLSLFSFTCSCLATIDQFFVTSQNVNLRRFSNIKWTHRIVFITIIVSLCHSIPYLIFLDVSSVTNTCIVTNNIYSVYLSFYTLGWTGIIPVTIMIIFGYLSYRNIHLTRILIRQSADRQLTQMTLIHVILVVITMPPYGIQAAYNLITSGISKDTNRLMKESFAMTIFTLVTYLYYTGSCYTFLISSSRFRRAVKQHVFFWKKNTQVAALAHPILPRTIVVNRTQQ